MKGFPRTQRFCFWWKRKHVTAGRLLSLRSRPFAALRLRKHFLGLAGKPSCWLMTIYSSRGISLSL